jgi:hypothetical protein
LLVPTTRREPGYQLWVLGLRLRANELWEACLQWARYRIGSESADSTMLSTVYFRFLAPILSGVADEQASYYPPVGGSGKRGPVVCYVVYVPMKHQTNRKGNNPRISNDEIATFSPSVVADFLFQCFTGRLFRPPCTRQLDRCLCFHVPLTVACEPKEGRSTPRHPMMDTSHMYTPSQSGCLPYSLESRSEEPTLPGIVGPKEQLRHTRAAQVKD